MSEAIEKTYEIRPLVAADMGVICKIVSAIGVKQFKDCFKGYDIKDTSNLEAVGISVMFDIAGIVVENIPNAEEQIQAFLASLTGQKLADIKKMPFADYGGLIIEVITKDDFKDFFNRVMKLFSR